MLDSKYVDLLASKRKGARLRALKKLVKKNQTLDLPIGEFTSLSIHTDYSFSPYTPSLAAYMACKFGVGAAGLMDNYTLKGAKEFIKACRILGLTYSVGVELRACFDFTDITSANVSVMGIASRFFRQAQSELMEYRKNQIANIKKTIEGINLRFEKYGISIDFKSDVDSIIKKGKERVYLSKYAYYALAKKLYEKFALKTVDILAEMGFDLSPYDLKLLSNESNTYYVYDLTNVLFNFRDSFYLKKSYKKAENVIEFAHKFGAICAFQYVINHNLCDSESTRQYLFELLTKLKALGFDGVCFDPNKMDQPLRQAFLAKMAELELLPFMLNTIEFPRKNFTGSFPDEETKSVMRASAYTVIGSEMSENLTGEGFISSVSLKTNDFNEKVKLFSKIGRGE